MYAGVDSPGDSDSPDFEADYELSVLLAYVLVGQLFHCTSAAVRYRTRLSVYARPACHNGDFGSLSLASLMVRFRILTMRPHHITPIRWHAAVCTTSERYHLCRCRDLATLRRSGVVCLGQEELEGFQYDRTSMVDVCASLNKVLPQPTIRATEVGSEVLETPYLYLFTTSHHGNFL